MTIQLKPNEVVASDSTGAKVVKRLPIKIPPPKAFEGDRDYERVATWLREVENFFRAMVVEEKSKGADGGGVVRRGCVDLVGGVHQGLGDCGKSDLVTSRFTPEYANIRARVAWLDLRQTPFDQSLRGEVPRGCEYPPTCIGFTINS